MPTHSSDCPLSCEPETFGAGKIGGEDATEAPSPAGRAPVAAKAIKQCATAEGRGRTNGSLGLGGRQQLATAAGTAEPEAAELFAGEDPEASAVPQEKPKGVAPQRRGSQP